MSKNILSMGQNAGYQPIPRNQSLVPAGFWNSGLNLTGNSVVNPVGTQNTKPWNEILPVEEWLRDFSNKPNSSVFPSADGATYAQMLQNNPINPTKPEMTITEEGRKLRDKIDEILHRPTNFSPENLDKWSGHGPNPGLNDLNNWYSNMEQADNLVTNNKINELAGRIDKFGNKIDEFGNKIDDFGNRFNNIDDHLGRLDSRVDYTMQNVDKLKRGVGEANGKIIGKIDGLTGKVDDIAQNVAGLGGKVDGLTTRVDGIYENVDELKRGLGEVSGKIIGKIDANGRAIGELANRTDDIAQNVEKLKRGLGEVSGKIIAKVDDNSKAIGDLADKVDDIAKQVSKQNTKTALIGGAIALAGIAVAGIAGYLLGKNNDKDDKVASEETTPVVTTPKEKTKPEESTPVTPVVPVEPTKPTEPTTPVGPVDPNSPIDADGNATVQKGDGLWHIAERYLEYTFKNEPDKFANLSEREQHRLIMKEVHRIADLNGFKLVTRVINGKEQIVTEPMIHPGDKVQVVKKVDIAA